MADIPDRLPYLVAERVYGAAGPVLACEHHLSPITLVMATKRAGTLRPFMRLEVLDYVLYQALVDKLSRGIETVLRRHKGVWLYRPGSGTRVHPQAIGNSWPSFLAAVRADLEPPSAFARRRTRYVLSADVSGFYLHIRPDELERRLLAYRLPAKPVRDLRVVLDTWQALGLRGLPQGLPPSSLLANFYLVSLDEALGEAGIRYRRFMDDIWVFSESYASARAAQHLIEAHLYEQGMTLASDKLRIEGVSRALSRLPEEDDEFDLESLVDLPLGLDGDYAEDDEEDDGVADREHAVALMVYENTIEAIRLGEPPAAVRPILRVALRRLGRAGDAMAIDDVPELVRRFPDLVRPIMRYAAAMDSVDRPGSHSAFLSVLQQVQILRDQERIHVCVAALGLKERSSTRLAATFGRLAREDPNGLVRARALLAWGLLGRRNEFQVARDFLQTAPPHFHTYAVVAIQGRRRADRDRRYDRWSTASAELRLLTRSIRRKQIPWSEI